MTGQVFSPLRRTLLRAMFASVALPTSSFAEPTTMRIRLTFNNQSMTATLYDNPSAHDLVSVLPLDLTIDNYANNEKIAYLPRKLTEERSGPFGNEAPGDLCYFAPWGNLALFYANYRWSDGVIRLSRFAGSLEPLRVRGKFPLRIGRIS